MLWCWQTIPESKPFQTQSTCICLFIPNRSLDRNMEIIRTLLLLFKSHDRFGIINPSFACGHSHHIAKVLKLTAPSKILNHFSHETGRAATLSDIQNINRIWLSHIIYRDFYWKKHPQTAKLALCWQLLSYKIANFAFWMESDRQQQPPDTPQKVKL